MAQGRWVVIEDINLAPPEVLATLVPLLERGQLHIPQRAQVVEAAPGFQLLASVTSAPGRQNTLTLTCLSFCTFIHIILRYASVHALFAM